MTDYKDILIPKDKILDKAFFDDLINNSNTNEELTQAYCYLNYAIIALTLERVLVPQRKEFERKIQIDWEELVFYRSGITYKITYQQTKSVLDKETTEYFKVFLSEEYYKKISSLDWEAPLEEPKQFDVIRQAYNDFLSKNDTLTLSHRILREYLRESKHYMAELSNSINANAWRLSYLFKSMRYDDENTKSETRFTTTLLTKKTVKSIVITHKLMIVNLASIMAWAGLIEAVGKLLQLPSLLQYSELINKSLIQKSITILIAEHEELILFLRDQQHPLLDSFSSIQFTDLKLSKYTNDAIKEATTIIKPYLTKSITTFPLDMKKAKSHIHTHILEINENKKTSIV